MDLIWQGIKFGLALSILVGPIFFAIIQAGVEEGVRAGTAVGLGIWISDFLFIFAVYFGLSYIDKIASSESFALIIGVGGSIILAGFGLGTLITAPKVGNGPQWSKFEVKKSSYLSHWTKGFLINTVNPFTFFFWIGIASTVVADGELNKQEALYFFGGILGTIIITDFAKAVLAKRIRQVLRPVHLMWLRRISGGALIVFGVVLLMRVLWM